MTISFSTSSGSNSLFTILNSGNLGIGTSSPGSLLSLNNLANFSTGTSTFYSTGGINISGGCFSSNGTCVGGSSGSGTVSFGAQGQFAFYNAAGTTVTATSSLVLAQSGNLGVGTSTPWGRLSVVGTGTGIAFGTADANNTLKFVIQDNGSVGIGNTSPTYPLDVAGFINTDQYSGFKQAGTTVLYASTTNATLALGASVAAAWMSASSTSWNNIAIGPGALATTPTSGAATYNIAIGGNALNANTTGADNTGVGVNALFKNTTGNSNAAFGYAASQKNTIGSFNTAIGYGSLFANTTGSNNAALGYSSLGSNITGNNNTALGYYALINNKSATNTTAVGQGAGYGASGS